MKAGTCLTAGLKYTSPEPPSVSGPRLTFSGPGLGAGAVVAAEAGVERAAEALIVENRERVEANAGVMVKFAAVRNMTAKDLAL